MLCERCGTEIRTGEPVAMWANGMHMILVHRFPYQCDPRGVEMVKDLERRLEEQKSDGAA